MKNIRKFLLFLLCFATLLSFAGCPRALKERMMDPLIDFADEDMAQVFAKAFDKDYKLVSEQDLASIEVFEILTYSETQQVSIGFKGSLEDPANSEKTATVDITGMVFESFDDFKYLTGLRKYNSLYSTNSDYSFLANCKSLESITIEGNAECRDYSFLKELPNLTSFTLDSGVIDDISVISSLTQLEELCLQSVTTKIDPDFLWQETYDPATGVGDTFETLGYDETGIAEISFVSSLTNLKKLTISSSLVKYLEPLTGLKNLTYLDLSINAIADITPLAELPQLEYIDLTQNVLTDLTPLSGLDPEKVDRVILDLCDSIEDWSPLDYLGRDKVQGRPASK